MTVKTGWQSRITRTGEESPDNLLANPGNWRVHPQFQQDALKGVLDEVGWVQQVIVNERTGHLIDGHLRVTLALRHDEPSIPVTYVDLDEHEENLILATLDPLAAMAATDTEKLDELLRDVQTGEAAVQEMLAELAENAGITPLDWDDMANGEESSASYEGASVWVSVGPYRITIERDKFEEWEEDLRQDVGFDDATINHEISRRLGFR